VSSSDADGSEDLAAALDSALQALDHLGEGEPDGLGIDHIEVDRLGDGAPVEDVVDRIASEKEWDRLERPDFETSEIAARILSVKEACAKALGTGISGGLGWEHLAVPRLAERPFRVQCDRYGDLRLYAASALVSGVAVSAAATFPKD